MTLFVVILMSFSLACQAADSTSSIDPIDTLIEKLDANLMWVNGIYPIIDLPEGASPEIVISAVFKKVSFTNGPITEWKILETRKVKINDTAYWAANISSDLGPKIVLIKYEGEKTGWWSRVFSDGDA